MQSAYRLALTALSTIAMTSAAAAEGTWTGFHAGLDLGYGNHEASITDTDYDYYGGTLTFEDQSILLGLRGGYDYQMGSLVVGGELNWSYTSFESDERYSGDIDIKNTVDWLASLRVRGGLAIDATLIYLTFGVAMGDITHDYNDDGDPGSSVRDEDNDNVGLVMGVGFEHMLSSNFSVRAELVSYEIPEVTGTTPNGSDYEFGDTIVAFNIGGSYRF